MLSRPCLSCAFALAACGGDDGVHHLPDAPPAPDAVPDAPADAAPDAPPMLTTTMPVMPTGLGSLCAVAYDAAAVEVLVYPCLGADIHRRTPDGIEVGTIARPGEAANDVDIEVAPAAFTLGTTAIAAGTLLFANGETDVAEIYAPTVSATAALVTQFGASHVVGLGHHVQRGSLFVVQDRVAAANGGNTVAELDPVTGAVRASFSTAGVFDVNYGDLDVCDATGNLFLVSSNETSVAELTPAGALVAKYPLPAEVSGASGLALEGNAGGNAWISDTNGGLWRIAGLPCPAS